MQVENFPLSSEECEVLLSFRRAGTVEKLASLRRRDPSVISRQLQRLAQKAKVLEKQQGQWKLTSLGERICDWSRSRILEQRSLLSEENQLRIVTTQEFASRVLIPNLNGLLERTRFKSAEVKATEGRPIEQMLLSGQADIGFDCGRPHSPFIRYRLVKAEPLTVVFSPALKLKGKVRRVQDLLQFPHIEYTRISAEQRLGLGERIRDVSFVGDSIASCRAACVAGLGWALLPVYSVHAELRKNLLGLLSELNCEEEKFGVWQLRSFPSAGLMEQAIDWLKRQSLSY